VIATPVVTAAVSSSPARRPPLAVAAVPARVVLAGSVSMPVRVTNSGSAPVVVDVVPAGYRLDLHGRPRAVPVRERPWLRVRPARLVLHAGAVGVVSVSASPVGLAPGDHEGVVLLTTRPRAEAGLSVRTRLGVLVSLRMPGRLVRRLAVTRLRLRGHRVIELVLANRGNVTETVGPGRLVVVLRRGGRVVARLRPVLRRVLARSTAVVDLRLRGRGHGRVSATVELGAAAVLRRVLRL